MYEPYLEQWRQLGFYCLEIMTWSQPGIDDHANFGPLAKLAELADIVEYRLGRAQPGARVSIRDEFAQVRHSIWCSTCVPTGSSHRRPKTKSDDATSEWYRAWSREGSMTEDAFIRTPVFVVDGEDISVYDSLEDTMAALEGVDVEDGLYSVYDADGRRIALKGVGVKRSRFVVEVGVVQVERIEAEPTGADELRQSLLRFGRYRGWDVDDETQLAVLVELARRT